MTISGSIGFEDDNANKNVWSVSQVSQPDSITLDDNDPRSGHYSARIEVGPGDKFKQTAGERAEFTKPIGVDGKIISESVNSGTKYFGFSVKVDKNWVPAERGAIWQLHGPSNTPPGFSFQVTDKFSIKVNGGSTNLDKQTNYAFSDGSINKGEWVDFIVKIKFSASNDGEIEIWRQDEGDTSFKQVLSVNAPVIQAPGGNPMAMTHKHGLYRNPEEHTQVLWLDNWTRADTFAEVKGVFTPMDGGDTPKTPHDSETTDTPGMPDTTDTHEATPIRVGSERGEKIVATDGDDHVRGLEGNDTIKGGAGNDMIDGGPGADVINTNAGADVIVLRPGEGRDVVNDFEDGVDTFSLEGGLRFEQLSFVDVKGAALIKLGGEVLVKVNRISASQLSKADFNHVTDVPPAGEPDTDPTGPTGPADPTPMTVGTNANDGMLGNNSDDHLVGLAGNDTLKGNGGDDILDGGAGSDMINGNAGADTFVLRSGEGRDVINDFEDGVDHFRLDGGLHFDDLTFVNVNGATLIKEGKEILAKVNWIEARQLTKADFQQGAPSSADHDTSPTPPASEHAKRSVIDGTSGDDRLAGDDGDNYLIGHGGRDTLKGNAGDDIIDGGAGSDIINGNAGADIFVLRAGEGRDVINDFEDGVDTFLLQGGLSFKQLTFTRVAGATLIKHDGDVLAKVKGVDQNELTAADFHHDTGGHPLADFYIDGHADILI